MVAPNVLGKTGKGREKGDEIRENEHTTAEATGKPVALDVDPYKTNPGEGTLRWTL